MRLKDITFVFENCDDITVDGKYIGEFQVDDLHTKFARIACNSIDRIDVANTVVVEIHKDANKDRYEFGQAHIEEFKQKVFDRLSECNDITQVLFTLVEGYVEDGEIPREEYYSYFVDWIGTSDYENDAQSSYISKDGHLYIVIAKDKRIDDFFDLRRINDSESMDLHFNLCGIGDEYSDPSRYKEGEDYEI